MPRNETYIRGRDLICPYCGNDNLNVAQTERNFYSISAIYKEGYLDTEDLIDGECTSQDNPYCGDCDREITIEEFFDDGLRRRNGVRLVNGEEPQEEDIYN